MITTALTVSLAFSAAVGQTTTMAEPVPTPAATAKDVSYLQFETTMGNMVVMLDHKGAPRTCENFLRYVDEGFYSGTIFHRVISDFVVQGGGFDTDGNKKDTHPGVFNEWRNGLQNIRGSLSMARLGRQPHSGTSQFFINTQDNAALDTARDGAAYAVFGMIVEGLDIVDEIRAVPTSAGTLAGRTMQNVPVEPVVIKKVTRLDAGSISDTAKKATAEWAQRFAEQRASFRTIPRHAEILKQLKGAKATDSGLRYVVLEEGEGANPTTENQVKVEYIGWFPEGGVFDSSLAHATGPTITFGLGGVIKGWQEGVGMMTPGSTYLFEIPGDLAYGERGRPGIPPNQTLIFQVTLIDIPG